MNPTKSFGGRAPFDRISGFVMMSMFLIGIGTVGCDSFSPQTQLEKWVADQKASQKLPKQMGDGQQLIDIQSGELELIQIFRLQGVGEKIAEDRKTAIREQVVRELKKKKEQIQNLISYRVVMTFIYRNADGTEVHRFAVKPWEEL